MQSVTLGPFEDRICRFCLGQVISVLLPNLEIALQRYVVKTNVNPTFYFFPYRTKFDGLNAYLLGLVGLRFIIKLDARPFPSELNDFILGRLTTVAGTNIDFDEDSRRPRNAQESKPTHEIPEAR